MPNDRSEFFKQLESLRNYSTNTQTYGVDGTNLPSLAFANTPLPSDNNRDTSTNIINRAMATSREGFHNVTMGLLGVFDGIFDLGANIYGAISGDREGALDVANFDWQSRVTYLTDNFQQLISPMQTINRLANSDINDVGDFFSTITGFENYEDYMRKQQQDVENSLLNDMGKFGDIVRTGEYAIGNILPSILIPTLGVSSRVASGITLGLNTISALGSGTTEALNEGATYGQAFGKGAIQAGIEAGTEFLPFSKNIGGVIKKTGGKTLSKVIQSAVEEGTEEAISELLAPISDVTYKKGEALDPYKFWENPEQTKELLASAGLSFAGGAIGGGFSSSIQIVNLRNKYGKKGVNVIENVVEANEILAENEKLFDKDLKKNQAKIDENQAKVTELLNKAGTELQEIKKTDKDKYNKIREMLGNPQTLVEDLNDIEDMGKVFERETAQNDIYNNKGKQLTNLINSKRDSNIDFRIASSEEMSEHGNASAYYDPNTKEIVVNNDYRGMMYEKIAHEGIYHAIVENDSDAVADLHELIEGSSKYQREYNKCLEQAKKLGYSDTEIDNEALAMFVEKNITNSKDFVKVFGGSNGLMNDALSFIKSRFNGKSKVVNKISNLLEYAKGDESTESTDIKYSKVQDVHKSTESTQESTQESKGTRRRLTQEQIEKREATRKANYEKKVNDIKDKIVTEKVSEDKLSEAFENLTQDKVLSKSQTIRIVNEFKKRVSVGLGSNIRIKDSKIFKGSMLVDLLRINNSEKVSDKTVVSNFVNAFLDNEVVVYKTENGNKVVDDQFKGMTLSKLLADNLYKGELDSVPDYLSSIEKYKEHIADDINEAIENYKKTSYKKARENEIERLHQRNRDTREFYNTIIKKLNERLSISKEAIKDLKATQKLSVKTYNQVTSLQKKIESKKVQYLLNETPKLQTVVGIIAKGVKGLKLTSSGFGFTPNSVAKLLGVVPSVLSDTQKGKTDTKLSAIFTQQNCDDNGTILYNDQIKQDLLFIEENLDEVEVTRNGKTTTEFKFKGNGFNVDLSMATYRVVSYFANQLKLQIENAELTNQLTNAQAKASYKTLYNGYKKEGKAFNGFIGDKIDKGTPFPVLLRRIFGRHNGVYQVTYENLQKAFNKKKLTLYGFTKAYDDLKTKFNITDKVLRTKLNFANTELAKTNLMEIYALLQTDRGRDTLVITEDKKPNQVGGYTYYEKKGTTTNKRTIKLTNEDVKTLENLLSTEEKDFAKAVLFDLYNGSMQEYKKHADVNYRGYEDIIKGVYYPQNRANIEQVGTDRLNASRVITDPRLQGNFRQQRNMSHIAIDGLGIEERFIHYSDDLAHYGEVTYATDRFNQFWNGWDDGKSRLAQLQEMFGRKSSVFGDTWTLYDFMTAYVDRVAGRPISNVRQNSKVFNNVVAYQLYANPSVILKQFASLPTILNGVSYKSFIKGLPKGIQLILSGKYGETQKRLADASGLLANRWFSHEAIKADVLTDNLTKLQKVLGAGMELADASIIVGPLYQMALYEAEALGYGKVGDEVNFNKAIEIVEDLVLTTQSNNDKLVMSVARSGQAGFTLKILSVFTSDLQNKISTANELLQYRKWAEKRIKMYESELNSLSDDVENQARIKELNNLIAQEKVEIGKLPDRIMKYLISVLFGALIVTGVSELVKRLLGRKGWKEDTKEDALKTFVIEMTLANIPYLSQLANAIEYDQTISQLDLATLNQTLTAIKELGKGKDANYQKVGFESAKLIGMASGIPVNNIYNVVMGIGKNVSGDAYIADYVIRGTTEKAMYTQMQEAIESGYDKKAKATMKHLLYVYKGGKVSDKAVDEIYDLIKKGYNILPSTILGSYTNEKGEKVELTSQQTKEFTQVYFKASTAINELVKSNAYNKLTEEQKAYAIKTIYSSYYDSAKAKVLKVNEHTNLSKLLANEKFDIAKFIPILTEIRDIKGDEETSRKDLVGQYLAKINRLSNEDKMLVLFLSGYKIDDVSLGTINAKYDTDFSR